LLLLGHVNRDGCGTGRPTQNLEKGTETGYIIQFL
jgi:hypothetical protein